MSASDVAIVASGGGLQGSFIAGVLNQILAEWPEEFEAARTLFAASASVAGIFYYLSHQREAPTVKVWTRDIPKADFLNYDGFSSLFKKGPIYDIDVLVDEVFKKQNPLDIEAIKTSPITFLFPAINCDSGDVELFANIDGCDGQVIDGITYRDWRNHDIYELIKAAKALPAFYDRSIRLGEHCYVDGDALMPILLDFPHAPNLRKLVVMVGGFRRKSTMLLMRLFGYVWYAMAAFNLTYSLPRQQYLYIARKPGLLRRLARRLRMEEAEGSVLLIMPHKKLKSRVEGTAESIAYNFEVGREYVRLHRERIGAFLKGV